MNTSSRVLVVDDEMSVQMTLPRVLRNKGYEVISAKNQKEACKIIRSDIKIDLALVDLHLPDGNGLELITNIKASRSNVKVIVLTGYGTVETAVEAKEKGAVHFITKPFNIEEVISTIDNTLSQKKLEAENHRLKIALDSKYRYPNIIGESSIIHELLDLIRKVSPSDSTVLVTGESGTGKDLVAKAIHFNSPREKEPFVAINCGAIPSELLESELFGHMKGSFTNASSNRIGRFEFANNGTIFFDEIGDMSPHLQVKLLRVLQEGTFTPVGGNKVLFSNVRVIAATNVNLEKAVADGRFREDLYYRLNVIPIKIPSLKERKEDIPILLNYFTKKFNAGGKNQIQRFTPEAIKILCNYSWPGNIRELENLIERLSILKSSGPVDSFDLSEYCFKNNSVQSHLALNIEPTISKDGLDFYAAVKAYEEKIILQALKQTNWNRNQAAILLKLNRTTLIEKIKKNGLKPPEENFDKSSDLSF